MENLAEPRLLAVFFEYATDEALSNLDNLSKAALRLSCKNAKAFVDGTITTAAGQARTLETILRCDWQLSKLFIEKDYKQNSKLSRNDYTPLFYALCSKFPMLQVLEIDSSTVPYEIYAYDLPANIGHLSKLKNLKITLAQFSDFPASFGQLSSLERLELYTAASARRWRIEGLAPLKQLMQLKYLQLDGYLVSEPFFPGWLGSCHFPVLEDLTLSGWLLSLPSSISNFSNLTALIIERSLMSELPESIGSLSLLRKLCLGYAREASANLPTSFSKLTALEQLDVSTDMQSFGRVENINKLTNLTFLRIQEDLIVPYPEFLWTFTSLQILTLSRSSVPSLPDALGNLKELEFLFLQSHYNLEELPETIGNLTCLTSFNMRYCPKLLKLPESIGNLKDLRELRIYQCRQVKTLPESIGDLQRLEMLEINHVESFERLPASIGNLSALSLLIFNYAGEVIFPESFADLVLDKPAEECSLEKVYFFGKTNAVLYGPRSRLAFGILRERGVLLSNRGIDFS
jgi:Leucine-rich repeat (LRR) protein